MADTTSNDALVSIVLPVYNEADNIRSILAALQTEVRSRHETLLVYDTDDDTTLPPARDFGARYPQMRLQKNSLGRGVLNALKTGIREASGDVVVITMADLSDDVSQIDEMASLVRSGAGVVSASRYMRGGGQIGGPALKSTLSRGAGLSLRWLAGLGTHDATNNFKAYSRGFLDAVAIESRSGFELGLELTSKAHLRGLPIVEIPTTWRDRSAGESNFRLMKWLPSYLFWYFTCLFGTWTGQPRRAARASDRARLDLLTDPGHDLVEDGVERSRGPETEDPLRLLG